LLGRGQPVPSFTMVSIVPLSCYVLARLTGSDHNAIKGLHVNATDTFNDVEMRRKGDGQVRRRVPPPWLLITHHQLPAAFHRLHVRSAGSVSGFGDID
jgi:hypothetical protein